MLNIAGTDRREIGEVDRGNSPPAFLFWGGGLRPAEGGFVAQKFDHLNGTSREWCARGLCGVAVWDVVETLLLNC